MIPAVPEVSIFALPLDTGGQFELTQRVGYFHVWQFEDIATGALSLDGAVRVAFGTASSVDDELPMGYNSRIQLDQPVDRLTIRWDAQAGRRVRLLVGPDARNLEANNIPARQLVTGTGSTTIAGGTTVVGTTAANVVTANPLRTRVTLQSDPANTGLIGLSQSSGITIATAGVILRPGDAFVIQSTALVRAISDTPGQLVRRIEEFA